MLHWNNPLYLYFSITPVLLGFLILFIYHRRITTLRKVFAKKLDFLLEGSSSTRRRIKTFLRMLALLFLILAIARPQLGESMQEIKSQGVEIVIAVDVSNSMMTEDVRPNRLEHAKKEISGLLDRLSGDRVGLVVFAGSAAMVSPLTNDYSAIKMFLDSLSTDSISEQGTAFVSALRESEDAFKNGGLSDEPGSHMTRVVILASDGEDQEPGALSIAKKMLDKGIRIFAVGFGTEKGGTIPERDQFGNLKGYKKDSHNNIILSTARSETLREIATAGGGAFYHATFGGNAMNSLKQDIDRLQKTEFDSKVAANYEEIYQPFLFIAILFAMLDLLISERRQKKSIWRGRFEVTQ